MSLRPIAIGASLLAAVAAMSLGGAPTARAADVVVRLTIKDHKFVPAVIEAPANVRFVLIVKNEDVTAEEFESHELNREKVVPPGAEVSLRLGPLKPGTYPFFGEFHEDTAQGKLVVK